METPVNIFPEKKLNSLNRVTFCSELSRLLIFPPEKFTFTIYFLLILQHASRSRKLTKKLVGQILLHITFSSLVLIPSAFMGFIYVLHKLFLSGDTVKYPRYSFEASSSDL